MKNSRSIFLQNTISVLFYKFHMSIVYKLKLLFPDGQMTGVLRRWLGDVVHGRPHW